MISFLSAIMQKEGNDRDLERRHNFVSQWQNREDWRSTLPKANATWPTCLIIAPSTVVHNWERELETVSHSLRVSSQPLIPCSGAILKSEFTPARTERAFSPISNWGDLTSVNEQVAPRSIFDSAFIQSSPLSRSRRRTSRTWMI